MAQELTYAIGDIHGRLDLLVDLLTRIESHADGRASNLVFIGDYIDRGPHSAGVVDLVRRLQSKSPRKVVCLQGNHEAMLLEVVAFPQRIPWWIENGGNATLESFGISCPQDIPIDVRTWMSGLPTLFEDERRYFVHAGLYPGLDLHRQTDRIKLWIRDEFLTVDFNFGKHVVHGHTPSLTRRAEEHPHRTNLDSGAVFGGPLTAGVFTEDRAGPVAFLEAGGDRSFRSRSLDW